MQYLGEFETHLTVALETYSPTELQRQLAQLGGFADSHAMKCLHILLPSGSCCSQPMLGYTGRGHLAQQLALAKNKAQLLRHAGYEVTRIKIEASPWNTDVPEDSSEAQGGRYFESHIKLAVPLHGELERIRTIAGRHGAHLSRNALRQRDDMQREHFLTLRSHHGGRRYALESCQLLQDELVAAGQRVLAAHSEYVVHDSNLDLDAGWSH